MAKEEKQNHRHQSAAEIKRMADVPQREFNERRRSVQAWVNRDALLVKQRFHFLQLGLDRQGGVHGVRAEYLARHGKQYPRLALESGRRLDFEPRRDDDRGVRHILEPDRLSGVMSHDHTHSKNLRRERLALGLDQDSLVRPFPRSPHP